MPGEIPGYKIKMEKFLAQYKEYLEAALFSIFGGAAGYILRKGQVRSFTEFVWDLLLSVFAGMMIFLLIHNQDIDEYIKAFMISMSACMGRETLVIFQKVYHKRIGGGADGDK